MTKPKKQPKAFLRRGKPCTHPSAEIFSDVRWCTVCGAISRHRIGAPPRRWQHPSHSQNRFLDAD